MGVRLTVADQLLLSAYRLGGENGKPFTAEQLVVNAWKAFPDTFGLRGVNDDDGMPIYPDSNRVLAEIMGSKPLRRQGLVEKVGVKKYRLTEAGRVKGLDLSGNRFQDVPRRSLDRCLQDNLRRLLRARAVTKLRRGSESTITFLDACSFWGITARSSAMALESKLANVEAVLRRVRGYAATKTVVIGREEVSSKDIDQLLQLHGLLLATFSGELDAIRRRTDER